MKRRHSPPARFATLATLAALLGAGPLRAELRLGSQLSPESIPEGESATYLVRIVGEGKFEPPVVKTDPSVKVENAGASQSLQIRGFNGARQADVTYSFILTPSKKGTFAVEAEIPIVGDALVTETSTLTVRERTVAEQAREPFVRLSLDRKTFYVGESIPFEVTVFLRQDIGLLDIGFPTLDSGNFVVNSYGKPRRANAVQQGFQAFTFDNTLSALKAGDFPFGPAKLQLVIREPFGMRVRQRTADVESDVLNLTVKALPDAGKPAGFAGAVGNFALAIDASPLKLHLGEPIAVELRVSGSGNFDALTLPGFSGDAGWKPYPAKRVEIPNRATGSIESLSFTQIVVPTTAHAELPPFRLSFFDPLKEEYVTLETDPIPLEITPDPLDSTASIVPTAPETARPATPDAPPPTEKMEDILTIVGGSGHVLSAPPARLLGNTTFWVAQSLPLGALAAMLVFFVLRRPEGQPRVNHAPRPFPETLESLRSAPQNLPALDFYSRALACLDSWEYHHPGAGGRAGAAWAPAVAEIAERHDFLHYAGNTRTAAKPVSEPERQRVLGALQSLPS